MTTNEMSLADSVAHTARDQRDQVVCPVARTVFLQPLSDQPAVGASLNHLRGVLEGLPVIRDRKSVV